MASANVFSGLLKPPPSVFDYQQQLGQIDAGNVATAGARQAQAATADQLARDAADRNAFAELMRQSGGDQEQALRGLLSSPSMALVGRGQAMQKANVDAAEAQAKTAQANASAGKTQFETITAKKQKAIQDIALLPDADAARASIASQVQAGVVPMQAAQAIMQGIPADPSQFAQWKHDLILKLASPDAQMQAQTTRRGQDVAASTAAAGQAMTAQHQAAQEAIARGQLGVAQGHLDVARTREGREAQAPKGLLQETDQGLMLVDPRAGTAMPVTAGGVPVKGKDANKPLAPAALKQLTEARDNASTMAALSSSFKDGYASKGVFGVGADLSLAGKSVMGSDADSVDWWKNYRKQAELVERHALFGAALTPGEQASWKSADIGPGMDAKVIKRNLETRARLTRKVLETTQQDLIDAGQPAARVNPIAGRQGAAEAAAAPAGDGWSIKPK